MPFIQNETVHVTLNQSEISAIIEKFLLEKFYHIRYSNMKLKSFVFDFDDDGGIRSEIVYEKCIKEIESIVEDTNG